MVMNKIERQKEVVEKLAQGETMRSIAAELDCSPATILNFKRKNQELIQKRAEELIEILPDIIEDTKQKIRTNRKLTQYIDNPLENVNTTALKEIPDILQFQKNVEKIQENVLKSVGILPSQSPSFIFNQINQDNSKSVVIEASIVDLIRKTTENMLDLPEIDVPGGEIENNIT